MPDTSPEKVLEAKLNSYFKFYIKRQLFLAILSTSIGAVVCSGITYILSSSILWSTLVLSMTCLLLIYVTLLKIVPPSSHIRATKRRLLYTFGNHDAIIRSSKQEIILADERKQRRTLKGYERRAWHTVVAPYLLMHPDASYSKKSQTQKANLQTELDALLNLRKHLQSEKDELSRRNLELSEAEDMAIDRLYTIEVAEAQLEQLQIEANANQNSNDLIKRLQNKEAEIEKLKSALSEDQSIVIAQKTELNQLKGELIREFETNNSSILINTIKNTEDTGLSIKLQDLESIEEQLKERDQHLTEAEDVLIKRLQDIAEREALLEQNEINVGIRNDD